MPKREVLVLTEGNSIYTKNPEIRYSYSNTPELRYSYSPKIRYSNHPHIHYAYIRNPHIHYDTFYLPLFAVDYKMHLDVIKNAISTKNTKELENFLKASMECERIFNVNVSINNSPKYYVQIRPFIEWVFYEDPDVFIELIDLIIQSNDETCYVKLINSLKGTDLAL